MNKKIYKGYELYNMIAKDEIKKDCKIKDTKTGNIAIWNGTNFKTENKDFLTESYDDIMFIKREFEILEDNTEDNTEEIEELIGYRTGEDDLYNDNFDDVFRKINELVKAVNKLRKDTNK